LLLFNIALFSYGRTTLCARFRVAQPARVHAPRQKDGLPVAGEADHDLWSPRLAPDHLREHKKTRSGAEEGPPFHPRQAPAPGRRATTHADGHAPRVHRPSVFQTVPRRRHRFRCPREDLRGQNSAGRCPPPPSTPLHQDRRPRRRRFFLQGCPPLEPPATRPPRLRCETIPSPLPGAPVAELCVLKSLQGSPRHERSSWVLSVLAKCLLLVSPFLVLRHYPPK